MHVRDEAAASDGRLGQGVQPLSPRLSIVEVGSLACFHAVEKFGEVFL